MNLLTNPRLGIKDEILKFRYDNTGMDKYGNIIRCRNGEITIEEYYPRSPLEQKQLIRRKNYGCQKKKI